MSSSYTKPHAVLARRVGEEVLLLDTASEKYFSLNEVGADFYKLITSEQSVEAAVASIASSYDAPQEQISTDMHAIVQELEGRGLLAPA